MHDSYLYEQNIQLIYPNPLYAFLLPLLVEREDYDPLFSSWTEEAVLT
jgi:hypothetical protein